MFSNLDEMKTVSERYVKLSSLRHFDCNLLTSELRIVTNIWNVFKTIDSYSRSFGYGFPRLLGTMSESDCG